MNLESPRNDAPPRRRRTAIIVFAVIASILGVWAAIFFHDGAPPEDADLRPAIGEEVSDGENSYLMWKRASDALQRAHDAQRWTWSDPPLPQTTSSVERAKRAAANEEWFRMNEARSLAPLSAALEFAGFSPPATDAVPAKLLSSFDALDRAALCAVEQGDWRGAWHWTEVSSEWKRRFWLHPQGVVPVLLASMPTSIADARLRLAQCLPDDLELLHECLATTETSEFPAGWRTVFLERQYAAVVMRIGEKQFFDRSRQVPPPRWAKTLYRPHRTQRLLAAWTRVALEEVAAGRDPAIALAGLRSGWRGVARFVRLATGNAGGEWAVDSSFVLPEEVIPKKYLRAVELSEAMTRTLLALRIHSIEHGDWPATLEDLVPAVLTQLPTDPYDPAKSPLRYSSERGVLWSVGGNGMDDGETLVDAERGQIVYGNLDRIVRLAMPDPFGETER